VVRDLPAPHWLVRAGIVSWLSLGVLGLAAVAVLGLSVFSTIVLPIVFAAVAAAVFAPLVDTMQRARIPRGLGALLTIVLIVALLAAVVAVITTAVIAQSEDLTAAFSQALADLQSWLAGLGIDAGLVQSLLDSAGTLVSAGSGGGLLASAAGAAGRATSLVIGLFLGVVFLFFLLRDGPTLPGWAVRNLGGAQAGHVTSVARSAVIVIRRYFTGRAVVAAFDAVVIGVGAAILSVPLVPAIAVLTFLGGFVPYLGAVVAGALAVVLALASGGFFPALVMLGIVLVVQNVLEPLVEARVIGQSLGLHPMLVIVATTVGGIAAGLPGLVLGAPLTGTFVRVRTEYRRLDEPPEPSPDDRGDDEPDVPVEASPSPRST
jgi:putative heme transporter